MKPTWAVRLPHAALEAAWQLRLEPSIEVAALDDGLWLRGSAADERLLALLRRLPGADRFDVLPDGQLRPSGSRLPRGVVPAAQWVSLRTFAGVSLPVAQLAGSVAERIPVRLVRASEPHSATLLVTTAAGWRDFGLTAPRIRLERLSFAMTGDGRVAVRGEPLPSIPGVHYYVCDDLAIPCGWRWAPPLESALVRISLDLAIGDVALFTSDASWELLKKDDFVPGSRSAIRSSTSSA
ncbi:MAG: hypothetical protein ACKV0T_02565 [Planctomycetales bacterium]